MKNNKTTQIEKRLAGTSAQYFTLKCFFDGNLVRVHTSKNYDYIIRLAREFNR
jgi:hypothetical protein